ncbi:MAG: ORF6N domain-containing protein [Olsenella sp.]|nr:ORF6N domain-containing protein [Olsenella sp.]MCI1288709.1 ORF6N domain-containing protein [Olsenella sp.]
MTDERIQARAIEKHTEVVQVPNVQIRNMIYMVRGEQVMLDSDLASLYGVETRTLNQAVTRNPNRFPERFCFRLTKDGADDLKSQFVISSADGWGGRRRSLPRVFTEQGVSMLSAVLRSDTAIEVSIRIMDAFVEMRRFIADNAQMLERISTIELRQLEYQKCTDERFERIFDYMDAHEEPIQRVFFDGQVWDAFELLTSLVLRAKREIVLVDGYVDTGTLNVLAKKHSDVRVTIWTHPKTRLTQRDVDTFNAQYPKLEVRHTDTFHNRFLILDGTEAYLVGASLKDAWKKTFGIARIEDEKIVRSILERLNKEAR